MHPRSSYEGIGVSLPGRIDPTTQRLVFVPGLGWGGVDIKSTLERATGLPVELENAAKACALAELWSGRHGEGVRNLVAMTVSEGIEAGLVMNGQLVRGSAGVAGEFGHVSVVEDGPECCCGNRGCLEMFASNSAAVRYYSEFTAVRRGEVGGKSAMARLSFQDILRLVEQGDPKACKAIDQMAHYLGCGLANRCPNACLPSPLLPWHGDGAATALQRCCNGSATAPLPWASRCPWEQCRSSAVALPS